MKQLLNKKPNEHEIPAIAISKYVALLDWLLRRQ